MVELILVIGVCLAVIIFAWWYTLTLLYFILLRNAIHSLKTKRPHLYVILNNFSCSWNCRYRIMLMLFLRRSWKSDIRAVSRLGNVIRKNLRKYLVLLFVVIDGSVLFTGFGFISAIFFVIQDARLSCWLRLLAMLVSGLAVLSLVVITGGKTLSYIRRMQRVLIEGS